MVGKDFKDLSKTTAADKLLYDETFNVAKNKKYDTYQRGLALVVYKFFDKKSSDSGFNKKIMSNQQLAEELEKTIIMNIWKTKSILTF